MYVFNFYVYVVVLLSNKPTACSLGRQLASLFVCQRNESCLLHQQTNTLFVRQQNNNTYMEI